MYMGVMFDGSEYWCKIWKLTFAFKNDMWNLRNFHQTTWKSHNWDFDGILLSKVENVRASNLQESYLSWQWKKLQNWKRNWLVSSKLAWGIWQFWSEHLKISKICTLMGCLWQKYMTFQLKKYGGVMFDGTEYWCKIWRKTDFRFQKWHEEFGKFLLEHLKVSKFGLDGILLSKAENVWA